MIDILINGLGIVSKEILKELDKCIKENEMNECRDLPMVATYSIVKDGIEIRYSTFYDDVKNELTTYVEEYESGFELNKRFSASNSNKPYYLKFNRKGYENGKT